MGVPPTGVDRFLARWAVVAPHYRETPPAPDLRAFVACRWVRTVRLGGPLRVAPILPDGCSDVMVFDDRPPIVAGPDATTRWVRIPDHTVITGLRFRPGAVRAVLGCEAGLVLDGGGPLSDFAPGARGLHERLLTADALDDRHALLEDWVRGRLTRAGAGDRDTLAACRLLTAEPGLAIGRLADRFGWNARAVHRRFRAACGYGPKHLQRILRVQRALRAVHAAEEPSLAEVALAAGYADQPHMTRDFRDLTGFTPRAVFADARPGFGEWMDERF